ncbi:MAG: GatB/YqeY domain-containing protein [Cytophagales bacterium]|nr:GatB/YqeY domain-containing protein [Cytophagales bacterium]
MSLKETINADIKDAMKNKRKEELTTLRGIKSMIMLAETEKGAGEALSEDAELKLLTKAAKQRKEAGDLYKQENRADLAEKEFAELAIIQKYLPKQLTEEELRDTLRTIIEQTGAAGPQDMGKVMGVASKQLAGKAEGKAISTAVKELLAK